MFAEELAVELCDLVEGSQHRLRNSADRNLEQVNSRSICLGRLDRIEQVLIARDHYCVVNRSAIRMSYQVVNDEAVDPLWP